MLHSPVFEVVRDDDRRWRARHGDLVIRPLDRSHAAVLDEVNLACPVQAGFDFVFDRRPDFFAWADAVFERHRYLGAFAGERLVGYVLCGVTRGFTGAGQTPFFYAGDLRVLGAHRGHGLAYDLTVAQLEILPEDCAVGFAIVKEGNRAAEAFVDPTRCKPPVVVHRSLCRFEAQNVLLLRLPTPPGRARVRRARVEDLDDIAALTRRELGRRLFGPAPSAGDLLTVGQRVPGLGLDHTYVAERGGQIVGALVAWNEEPARRVRVLRYPLTGRLLRAVHAALRLGYPDAAPLPPAGGALRTLTLSRVAIADRDPAVLADLLAAVARDHRDRHIVHLGFAADDPLAAATRGYLAPRFTSRAWLVQRRRDDGGMPRLPAGAADPYLDLALL